MLEIKNLRIATAGKEIVKGVDLSLPAGEVHAIMGPNGSGKSTLSNVLAGRPGYAVTGGDVLYEGRNLVEMPTEMRAREGVFLAFQYPAEIPGVRPWQFLKAALDARREYAGEKSLSVRDFSKLFDDKVKAVGIDPDLVKRSLNEGFSGGEKKRNEMLQLEMLEPRLAILDETDSGLDVDALRIVAEGINKLRNPSKSIILVTHYQRILNYVVPDKVHVLIGGKVVRSGDKNLAAQIESQGYDWLDNTAGATKS